MKPSNSVDSQASHKPAILGDRQRNLLSDSIHVEEEFLPSFVRPMVTTTIAIVLMFFIWAAFTKISEVARAPGEIIPAGQAKLVQHLDGGRVQSIAVEERMLVEQGQELLRIDGTEALAELHQMQVRLIALTLRGERLSAFSENRPPDFARYAGQYQDLLADQQTIYQNQLAARNSTLAVLDKQIEQRKQRIMQNRAALFAALKHQAITRDLTTMREQLAERKLVKRTILLETLRAKVTAEGEVARLNDEIDVSQQELAEMQHRRTDSLNQLRQDALSEMGRVRAEMAEVEEAIRNLSAKVDRLLITAPNRGYVQDLKVITLGQVIQPGAILMKIVPDDVGLEAEIRIQPKDIGYVQVGQSVNMRISSFDYARYGFATGKLKKVSASSIVAENNEPYYRAWVSLDQPYVGRTPGQNLLQSGMGVDAEIVTGEKTFMTYLSKPVIDVTTRAFKER